MLFFLYFYNLLKITIMKKINLILILIFAFSFSLFINTDGFSQVKNKTVFGRTINPNSIDPNTGLVRCVSDEYEMYLQEKDPKRMTSAQFEAWLAPLIAEYKTNQSLSSQSGGIITIPVVVHVIHNGEPYGVGPNITDEQVASQITVMTQDFRRMINTPGYNTTAVGADTQIEFALAKVDVNGNPTNGINRKNLCKASFSTTEINTNVKPSTIWDPTQYMNMWSVNFTDSSLLGYAQFPNGSGLGGLNSSGGSASTDGVVAGYRYFGSSSLSAGNFQAPFDKGRTMTHEVGHWLGLLHIWGSGGCNGSGDFCTDTPTASGPNYGCPTVDSCPSSPGIDMVQNYMDYTNDACMNIFTQNQKDRMVVIMNNATRRASLKTSTKDIAIPLFANDAEVIIENFCSTSASGATCANPNPISPNKIISLYNRGNTTLTSATITYNMDGGTSYTNNWTGSLAPNRFAYITLTNTGTGGTLNTLVTTANGTNDQRTSNNIATKTFGASGSGSIVNVPYTSFTFDLLGDPFGSETTWNLQNAAGTILYSGGPYADATQAGTQAFVTNQAWNLPIGCYTFTIDDSWGDGLSGSANSGGISNGDQGSWTIKANSGAVIVGTGGGDFGDSQSFSFTNTALSGETFNALDGISIYPNPTSSELNVVMYDGFDASSSYMIYNNLGQVVKSSNKIEAQNEFIINTSQFSNGIYFLKIEKDGLSKTLKFIKQ